MTRILVQQACPGQRGSWTSLKFARVDILFREDGLIAC